MRILSIDPGYERVGIAILEKDGDEKLLFSECFTTSPNENFEDRVLMIGTELINLIEKWKPTKLAIETLFFNTNQKTAMRVAEARGVIIYQSKKMGLDIYEYTPLQIKNAITGYGRASKDQVESMVRNLIKIEKGKMYDDEMDAIAIGLTACASIRKS